MKYIAITARGLEDVSQDEIREILRVSSKKIFPGRILFSTANLAPFLKKTQSVIKIYELKQECKTIDAILPFPVASPFRVVCSRQGSHDFRSYDVEKKIGALFFAQGNTVDLKYPKTIVFVDIFEENILVGIDKAPELLSKRSYRIKINNQSINACIAYGLVRLSGYKGGKLFLDPFSKDGVIAIEAARYKTGKIYAYDALFPHARSTEINASLAQVRKRITVSRIEPEWLDTKFHKDEVDCVVSAVPYPSRINSEKSLRTLYKELFYQLDFILKKNGRVVFIAPTLTLLKEMNEHFSLVEERLVSTSSLVYTVLVFKK